MSPDEPEPIAIDTTKVIEVGIAMWCLALAVIMLLPQLHQGDRHWWPWACVAGVVGGALALLYVRRGRGNAATALRARKP